MFVSLNFIKQFVKLPDAAPKDVASALTMSTVEVEGFKDQAQQFDGIVVGKIIDVVKHPQADRLWVCRVDIKTEVLQIICGGVNVQKGMLVAVAKVGSKVRWHGEGERITLTQAKIRGIESHGMIAASDEIGLKGLLPCGEKEILDLTPYDVRVGDSLAKALGLTDTIIEIDNKSMNHRPDLWGQYGLAREVAALYNTTLKPLKVQAIPAVSGPAMPLTVSVKDADACRRYMGVVIDTVTVRQSPWWLRRDLHEAGIGSINAIVDVTNYVAMILGQPMHAFDYHKIPDHTIVVDRAGIGKEFEALNGKTYTLPSDALLIKDSKQSLAIAGVIGGLSSAVSDTTTTIVLEAAHFDASVVRRTSMALGLRTEASARFEKKLDPTLVPLAMAYAVELILQIMPEARVASTVTDVYVGDEAPRVITVTKDFLDRRLGVAVDAKEITSILKRLGFSVVYKKNTFTITVPSFRSKGVTIPEDIVEEVARIYGYNAITPALPIVEIAKPVKTVTSRVERDVKKLLAKSFGYTEVYNYSFADPVWSERFELTRNRVMVKNAIAQELSYLRTSLLPGLMASAVRNTRWKESFKLFELGRVVMKTPGEFPVDANSGTFLPHQPQMLSGIAVAKTSLAEKVYLEVKGDLTELFRQCGIDLTFKELPKCSFGISCFELKAHAKQLGIFGIVKPELASLDSDGFVYVFWDIQYEMLIKYANFSRTYAPLPKFPSMVRDMSIVVATHVSWSDIERVVRDVSPLITSIDFFDVFTSPKLGAGKKSVAFTMTFAHAERTLESAEVDQIMSKIAKLLHQTLQAIVR